MTQVMTDGYPGRALSLQRNRFYPRKLMEVRHWQAEQSYHRRSRELLTRLGLGSGVLCGLEVTRTPEGTLVISSGVGVDGCGRIVVVPELVEIDVTQLTDGCGHPTGETASDEKIAVALCFHECGTDLVPMPPEQCDTETSCIASMTREAFSLSVTRTLPPLPHLPEDVCEELFAPTDEDRHQLLDRLDPRRCERDAGCIPLVVVDLTAPADDTSLDTTARVVIRSNRQLLDLILCLAERMDDCCAQPPVITPPRITGLWPWPDDDGTGRADVAQNRRLEMAFDHDLAEQGLDDPSSWLGVWLLGPRMARRLVVTRASGALGHVTVPPDGDGAAFTFELDTQWVSPSTLFVVMVRSAPGGPIHAAGPGQLALDAELGATGLDLGQRDQLWALTADAGNDSALGTALYKAAAPGVPPWLPTGDGVAGGELHIVYYPAKVVQQPPQLLDIWPPSGSVLSNDTPEHAALRRRFQAQPQLILLTSRPLAAAAIADPHAWLQAWIGSPDGEFLYQVRELALLPGTEDLLNDGRARYTFVIAADINWRTGSEVLVQLRSTPPIEASSPVGQNDPQVLLDADFAGTRLDSQQLFSLWSGTVPDPLPTLHAIDSAGVTLYDGVAGGLAHWGFTIAGIDDRLSPRRARR